MCVWQLQRQACSLVLNSAVMYVCNVCSLTGYVFFFFAVFSFGNTWFSGVHLVVAQHCIDIFEHLGLNFFTSRKIWASPLKWVPRNCSFTHMGRITVLPLRSEATKPNILLNTAVFVQTRALSVFVAWRKHAAATLRPQFAVCIKYLHLKVKLSLELQVTGVFSTHT